MVSNTFQVGIHRKNMFLFDSWLVETLVGQVKFAEVKMVSGSSKLVQNVLLGSQMSTQGVVLDINGPQIWS